MVNRPKTILLLATVAMLIPVGVQAGSLFGSVERGALRGLSRSAERGTARSLERGAAKLVDRQATRSFERSNLRNVTRLDLLNHEKARLVPTANPREVFRFTTRDRALTELREGVAPNMHMTAHAGPGRPLSAGSAMRRFGLPQRPEFRETIIIPKGRLLRANKVVGGAPGVGEVTLPRRLPPASIRRIVPIR